jgi:hypothetical protein
MSKWIDRALIISPVYYTLCTDEKDFYKQLKKINMPVSEQPEFNVDGAGATTHTFVGADREGYAIVCVPIRKDVTNAEMAAMIAHEAVHVFQYILKLMGEDNPSVEFEAYSIQMITLQLLSEYERQKKGIK